MHNLISQNQLAEWKHLENTVKNFKDQNDLINDYYECIIECDDTQQACKRICKSIFD